MNSPEGGTDALNGFNAVNRKTATNRGVYYVDITPISRRALDDPELIASDDLHPSGKMYAQWVQELLSIVRLILQRLP